MSKAEQIRRLYQEGKTVSEVAKALGIRYQHAYNELRRLGLLKAKKDEPTPEVYGEFIAGLELLGVTLEELSAKLERSPEGKKGAAVNLEPFGPEPFDGGFRAGLVMTVTLLEDGRPFGQVRAKAVGMYRSAIFPQGSVFQTFAQQNLPLNLWPYLRLYVDFVTAQMGLARLTLPLLKF